MQVQPNLRTGGAISVIQAGLFLNINTSCHCLHHMSVHFSKRGKTKVWRWIYHRCCGKRRLHNEWAKTDGANQLVKINEFWRTADSSPVSSWNSWVIRVSLESYRVTFLPPFQRPFVRLIARNNHSLGLSTCQPLQRTARPWWAKAHENSFWFRLSLQRCHCFRPIVKARVEFVGNAGGVR